MIDIYFNIYFDFIQSSMSCKTNIIESFGNEQKKMQKITNTLYQAITTYRSVGRVEN